MRLKTSWAYSEALRESQLANAYQQTVIGSIPEAIIAIDTQDRITLINDNARSLFRLSKKNVLGEPVAKCCGLENHRFLELIACNEPVTHAEVRIMIRGNANDFTLTCNPILSPRGERIGKIVIMNEINRLKGLVTKMMGAKAKLTFDDIQGRNGQFLRTVEQARMAAHSRSNVLLLGKSGTGKDLFAQAIHNEGPRRNGPYVAINCGAIPRDLITSELFGYSEGAFTGSRRGGSRGKFELADGGTIFLDEIAETPLELQTALLRVIEEKTVTRIGGTRVRPVDVRIIAATNKNLLDEVHKGSFREDLYYRLNVFAIHMIPLRERLDDIPLLVDVFVGKYGKAMGKLVDLVDERVLSLMMLYDWPGNVRELQNVIERMMNVVVGRTITADLLPPEIAHPGSSFMANIPPAPVIDNERDLIARMLSLKVRKNRIAQTLGMSRSSLYRKITSYGLETVSRKA
jgi:transcriptional regulator with PAS, ATPase and Fis domain